MIPKIIHYCWFGGKPLPADVKACIKSWEKHCPDYEIRRWDENNYDTTKNPFLKSAAEAKKWAFVSDYARLDIILTYGGIYLDTDVELIKPLDELLENKAYFGIQMKDWQINTGLGFGAEAGHPAVQAMFDEYKDLLFSDDIKDSIACPILNTRALFPNGIDYLTGIALPLKHPAPLEYRNAEDTDDSVMIFPPRFFDPYPSGVTADLMCAETFSIHHYSATWTSGKQRWKRAFTRLVGEGHIIALKRLLKR